MHEDLTLYFVMWNFFIVSFCGWIWETIYESIRAKKLVRRGVLTGPILPIYGIGSNLIFILFRGMSDHPVFLFFGVMVFCTTLEYWAAVALEHFFHTSFWTYEYFRFNYKGRIALIPSLFWGVIGVVGFGVLFPALIGLIHNLPLPYAPYAVRVLSFFLILDILFTVAYKLEFLTISNRRLHLNIHRDR